MSIPAYRYQVLFDGQLQPGRQREEVKRSLAAALRLNVEKAEGLFSGKKRVMKRTESLAQAQAFVQVFANAGAVASIETHDGVPVKSGSVTKAADPLQLHSPLDGESGELPPFRPFPANFLFKPALFIASLFELLLTLFYVGALFGAMLFLVYHTLLTDRLFELIPFPWLAAPVAALLLMMGMLALALLAKPLLGFIHRKEPYFEINREVEPEFFSYVEEIAALAGCTAPQVIRVNHSSELKVRPHWSWRGITKRQKVLTIGLPLLAGLDSRQLAALLTQALARWRPGLMHLAGQLLSGNIRWLLRAGYERDIVDRKLHEWQQLLPRLATGLERIKRVAAWSGIPARIRLRMSAFLSRRLLHRLIADSDILARQVVGNAAVSSAMQQARLIGFAAQNTLPALEKLWQEKGTLPDNLAQAVVARAALYPPQTQHQLEQIEARRSSETGGFRPTTGQRIALLESLSEKGSYDIAAPCAAYFRRLEKLMHVLTVTYYHNHLQIPVTTNKLVRNPTKGSQEYEANQRIARFFGPVYADFVPLRLRARLKTLSADAAELSGIWQQGVAQLLAGQQKARLAATTLAARDEELIELSNRELLQRSGVGAMAGGLTLRRGRASEELQQQCRDAENSYDSGVGELDTQLRPYVDRLTSALALLNSSTLQPRMVDAKRYAEEVQQLLTLHERIENNYPKLRELRLQTILLESLLSHQAIKSTSRLQDRIREQAADIAHTIVSFAVIFKQNAYPFEAEERYTNLLDWVLAQAADGEGPAADFDRGNDTIKQMALMQRLIVGRLTTIALLVEALMGLKPAQSGAAR